MNKFPGQPADRCANMFPGQPIELLNNSIEIIDNTRGGIAIENSSRKRERANGGQNSSPGCSG